MPHTMRSPNPCRVIQFFFSFLIYSILQKVIKRSLCAIPELSEIFFPFEPSMKKNERQFSERKKKKRPFCDLHKKKGGKCLVVVRSDSPLLVVRFSCLSSDGYTVSCRPETFTIAIFFFFLNGVYYGQ